jgi:general secretion pathway protein G
MKPNPSTRNQSRRTGTAGFTLIELLLVLVILGVLAAIVVPKFAGRTEQARNTAAKAIVASSRECSGIP